MSSHISLFAVVMISLLLNGVLAFEKLILDTKEVNPNAVVVVDLIPWENGYPGIDDDDDDDDDGKLKEERMKTVDQTVKALSYLNNGGYQMHVAVCPISMKAVEHNKAEFVDNIGSLTDMADDFLNRVKPTFAHLDSIKVEPSSTRNASSLQERLNEIMQNVGKWKNSRSAAPSLIFLISKSLVQVRDEADAKKNAKEVFESVKDKVDAVILLEERSQYKLQGAASTFLHVQHSVGKNASVIADVDWDNNLFKTTIETQLAKCRGKEEIEESECFLEKKGKNTTCNRKVNYRMAGGVVLPDNEKRLCWSGSETASCGDMADKCNELLCFNLDRKPGKCNAECGEKGEQEVTFVGTEKWHDLCHPPPLMTCFGDPCDPGKPKPTAVPPTTKAFELPQMEPYQVAVLVFGSLLLLGIIAVIIAILVVNCRAEASGGGRKHIHPAWFHSRDMGRSRDSRGPSDSRSYTRQSPSRTRR